MKKKLLMLILLSLIMVIILGCATQISEKPGIEEKQIKETKPAVQPKEEIVKITGDYDCTGDVVCSGGALYCSENGKLRLLEDCQVGCENGKCMAAETKPTVQPKEEIVQITGDYDCAGEVICSGEALYCSRAGNLSLLEDCVIGCDKGGKKCIPLTPATGNCTEIIPGHNNLNENRINMVFVGFGYDNLEIFKFLVDLSIDFDSNYYGLLSVEPFKSNKNKFNFWYVDDVQNLETLNPESRIMDIQLVQEVSAKLRTVPSLCNHTNQYSIGVINAAWASGPIQLFMKDRKIDKGNIPDCGPSDLNGDGCVNNADLLAYEEKSNLSIEGFYGCYQAGYGCDFDTIPDDDRVFYYRDYAFIAVHELGHLLGLLHDEYEIPGTSEILEKENQRGNCFFASSKEECLANAPWKDLLGKGCGEESVIDCTPEDENYSLEISCFEGCDHQSSGTYRPTLLSIMGGQDTGVDVSTGLGLDVFSTAYSFRLVNERLICQRIKNITGSVGGYCNKLI